MLWIPYPAYFVRFGVQVVASPPPRSIKFEGPDFLRVGHVHAGAERWSLLRSGFSFFNASHGVFLSEASVGSRFLFHTASCMANGQRAAGIAALCRKSLVWPISICVRDESGLASCIHAAVVSKMVRLFGTTAFVCQRWCATLGSSSIPSC